MRLTFWCIIALATFGCDDGGETSDPADAPGLGQGRQQPVQSPRELRASEATMVPSAEDLPPPRGHWAPQATQVISQARVSPRMLTSKPSPTR